MATKDVEPVGRLVKAAVMAEIADVSENHIRDLELEGVIPGYRFGKAVRFDPDEVLKALRQEAHTRPSKSPRLEPVD